ncbi:GNAT family N-acetyltransferase [Devosia nitrariae]|nr:GNAT family N-acetyltransferase [Devosia nitrariae]
MTSRFLLDDLRSQRMYATTVADRIWREWWGPHGATLADVEAALDECLDVNDLPVTLVAHESGRFLGTVTCVASDLAERSQYSPWIAALWVEPEERGQGLGAALLGKAEARLRDLGVGTMFLCAKSTLRRYYAALGWELLEQGVGPHLLDVWRRLATPAGA